MAERGLSSAGERPLRQPRALYMLFLVEMWERFSYYGMRALLVFYLTKVFLFSDERAYLVYGSYTALVYASPVLGGLVADRWLGYRKAVTLGALLMAAGHFAMAVESVQVVYLALGLLIAGNGFFKPNMSTIVGKLYEKNDPRRDGGFTIFYMGVNLGAWLAPLVCGIVGETYGWHYGFTLAGIGMVCGLAFFLAGQGMLEGRAEPPDPGALRAPVIPGLDRERAIYAGAVLLALVAWALVQAGRAVGYLLGGTAAVVLAGLVLFMVLRCDRVARHKMTVALVLTGFNVFFWAFFEQAGSSINLFTLRNVDRRLLGYEIPATVFQSVNPAFILLFGPVFASLWVRLGRRGREPSTPMKFALGMLQLGLGFAALYYGAWSARDDGMVALGWLVLGYFLHTTGELCLSPVGLSMITKLSVPGVVGLMMGTWFLSVSFAQYAAGLIATLTGIEEGAPGSNGGLEPAQTVMVYGRVFGGIALVAIAVGLLMVLLAPVLRRGMHDVH
ncbi:MAG: peptide MFS transporter [Acidobacteria bacterium]|nr:MAG: peptide MFS transporter [Acidobacteriota bacterium]